MKFLKALKTKLYRHVFLNMIVRVVCSHSALIVLQLVLPTIQAKNYFTLQKKNKASEK